MTCVHDGSNSPDIPEGTGESLSHTLETLALGGKWDLVDRELGEAGPGIIEGLLPSARCHLTAGNTDLQDLGASIFYTLAGPLDESDKALLLSVFESSTDEAVRFWTAAATWKHGGKSVALRETLEARRHHAVFGDLVRDLLDIPQSDGTFSKEQQ